MKTETLGGLLVHQARELQDRPAITFRGVSSGERTELGWATLENWVAKTTNLLDEDFALVPGDRMRLDLPVHWTTVVILLAAWRAGVTVVTGSPAGALAAAAVHEDGLGDHADSGIGLLVVGAGFGGRLTVAVEHGVAFGDEVLAQPDLVDDVAVDAGMAAMSDGRRDLTHEDLIQAGAVAAHGLGLEPGGRILSTGPVDTVDGLASGLLAALVVGAGVVLVDEDDPDTLDRIATEEQCTVRR